MNFVYEEDAVRDDATGGLVELEEFYEEVGKVSGDATVDKHTFWIFTVFWVLVLLGSFFDELLVGDEIEFFGYDVCNGGLASSCYAVQHDVPWKASRALGRLDDELDLV